jgi:hypothetical protein
MVTMLQEKLTIINEVKVIQILHFMVTANNNYRTNYRVLIFISIADILFVS